MRVLLGLWVLLAACAGPRASAPGAGSKAQSEASGCQGEDCPEAAADPADLDTREAREAVLKAEQARKEAAFRDRLSALREAEEARFRARAAEAPPEPEEEDLSVTAMAAELAALGGSGTEAGSSAGVRPGARAEDLQEARPRRRVEGPTPQALLETSLCLLAEDEAVAAAELRTRGRSRALRSAWALAMVELQALQEDILRELRHRGLAEADPSCSKQVKELLRALYGPGAAREGADATLRSVERLRGELELRAGLPRSDSGSENDERPRRPASRGS